MKKILIIILIFLQLSFNCFSQERLRFETALPRFVENPTLSQPPLELMYKVNQNAISINNQNRRHIDILIDLIFDLKTEIYDDQLFLDAIDKYYKQLRAYDGKPLIDASTTYNIKMIEYGIKEEVNNYIIRQKALLNSSSNNTIINDIIINSTTLAQLESSIKLNFEKDGLPETSDDGNHIFVSYKSKNLNSTNIIISYTITGYIESILIMLNPSNTGTINNALLKKYGGRYSSEDAAMIIESDYLTYIIGETDDIGIIGIY